MWAAACALLQFAMHRYVPISRWLSPPWTYVACAVCVAAAFALGASAIGRFRQVKTGIVPFSDSTALVTTGPYRFTRNPMYLAMALALLGLASLSGSVSPLLAVPMFILIINTLFIRHEERVLEAQFGEPYRELKARVRRWI